MAMASPLLQRCSVTYNIVQSVFPNGGGLAVLNFSSPDLVDAVIANNEAIGSSESGGGIYMHDSWIDIAGGELRDNQTTAGGSNGGGGAMYLASSVAVMDNVVIAGNSCPGSELGAGIFASGSEVTITNSRLVDNGSSYQGGAIRADYSSTVSLTNTAVLANQAYTGGGLYLAYDCELTLTSSVVAGNQATSYGGGVFLIGTDYTSRNVVIADNLAGDEGGGVYSDGVGAIDIGWSAAWWNIPEHYAGFTDPTGASSNVVADPGFLDTSAADAELWDLHLGSSSTLVDGGDPTALDPDGLRSDIGLYGGPGAGGFDLDRDGWFEWWQPGPYDSGAYPILDLDCDDLDPAVVPADGC
jgi:hypothetical protein